MVALDQDTTAADASTAVLVVPHPVFEVTYNRKSITADISPYVLAVTYTDYLSGQSDEIEIELEDVDGRWVNAWYPGKGDTLTLRIGYEGNPLLPCGAFEIDEISFDAPPSRVTIKALSTGVKKSVRTRVGRAYENTTLAAIAQRIAKRNKLTLVGKIRDIKIDRVTQYQERDVEFLTRLGREYGYAFKIVGTKLVFTELAALRNEEPVLTIARTDVTSIRLSDKIKDVYQEARGKNHDPKTKKLVVYGIKDEKVAAVGSTTTSKKESGQAHSGDTLKLSTRGTRASIEAKTRAALETANNQQTAGSLTFFGATSALAGVTFDLIGYGKLNGRYLIESARHRLERGGGYSTSIEVKRAAVVIEKASGEKPKGKALKVYGVKDDKVTVVGESQVKKK